jgi:hypothetical protein
METGGEMTIFPEPLLSRRYSIQADLWALHREQDRLALEIRPLEEEYRRMTESGGPIHGSKGQRFHWVREKLGPLHRRAAELRSMVSARREELLKVEVQLRETFKVVGRSLALTAGANNGKPLKDPFAYDVFVSHAVEDKDAIVRPLVKNLEELAIRVWYDESRLSIGDSLRQSLDRGLVMSRFGVVIISPAFIRKRWTTYELDSLFAREVESGKVILPIWHKVSKDEILQYSPILVDRVALHTATKTISDIALDIAIAVNESRG